MRYTLAVSSNNPPLDIKMHEQQNGNPRSKLRDIGQPTPKTRGSSQGAGNIPTVIKRIGFGPSIEADIWELEQHVTNYRKGLNDEGIWLFLTTLGCWSVTNHLLQFFALALTAMLFGFRLRKSMKEPRSFKTLIQTIEARIESTELTDIAMQELRQRLKDTQTGTLSYRRTFKEGGIFLLCWIFFSLTFTSQLFPDVLK